MDAKTLEKIRLLIVRLPKGSDFRADAALSREFFDLSEDSKIPDVLRDFCLDLSLRADAIETGPLGIADSAVLLAELEKRANLTKR